MEMRTLAGTLRKETGKGPARRLRHKGLVPAILYGRRMKEATGIAVNPDELREALNTPQKRNTIISLKLEDGSERYVLFKAFEVEPVYRQLLHVDFVEVKLDEKVKVKVAVVLSGKPVGVVDGGILSQARYELEVLCLPNDIPEKIEIDVTDLKIGHSVHVKEVKFPPGVEGKYETNFTIAAVVAPEKEEVAAPAAVPGVEAAAAPGALPGAPGAVPAAPGAAPAAPGAAQVAGQKPGAPGAASGAPAAAPAAEKAPQKGGGKEKK